MIADSRWRACPLARLGLLLSLGAWGCGKVHPSAAQVEWAGPGPGEPCGTRQRVEVRDVRGLMANIGRDHVDLVLAPGRYALSPCESGQDEWSDAPCGQLEQGDCSILRSGLELDTGEDGVPAYVGTAVPHCAAIPARQPGEGAVVDCGALPGSAVERSCLVAGDRSTIADVTVCNGSPPTPLDPGQPDGHRNGIMILAGKHARVEGVRVVNARRGVLFTAESGRVTSGEVVGARVENTSLAGILLWARPPDDSPSPRRSSGAQLWGRIERSRITRAGLHPIAVEYGFGGRDNATRVALLGDVVDAPSRFSVSFLENGAGASGNVLRFSLAGGRLGGDRGLLVSSVAGSDGAENVVTGTVSRVTFANGVPAVWIEFAGAGNSGQLTFDHNVYVGDGPGLLKVDLGAGSHLRIDGTARSFSQTNANFDVSGARPYFRR